MQKFNIPKKTDSKFDYASVKNQAETLRKLNNTQFNVNDFKVLDTSNGKFISLSDKVSEVATYPEDFGIKTLSVVSDQLHIEIYGGSITLGLAEIVCPDMTVIITEAVSYVGWEFSWIEDELLIKNFGATFVQDDAFIRKVMYKFEILGEAVQPSLTRVKHNSQVFPANFSR